MDDAELNFLIKMQDQAAPGWRAHAQAVNEAGESYRKIKGNAQEATGSLNQLVAKSKEAAEAFGAVWAASELQEKTIGAFAEMQISMTRLQQASGLTKNALDEIQESIEGIARSSLGASNEQIAAIAKSAAQLGVNGKTAILEYTTTVSHMADVSGISAQQVDSAMSRILSATGETEKGAKTFGDAFAALMDHVRGGGANLLQTAEAISSFTAGMKLSSEQILAISATVDNLGLRSRSATMAVATSLQAIETVSTKGGAALNVLAYSAGLTNDKFKELEKSNPSKAFEVFLTTVQKLKDSGQGVDDFLKSFGLEGRNVSIAIEAMASKQKELNDNLERATNSKGSLDKLWGPYAESITTAINSIKRSLGDLGEAFGQAFGPIAVVGLHLIGTALIAVGAAFHALPGAVQTVVAAVVILVPTLVAVIKSWQFLTEVILAGRGTLRSMSGPLGAFAKGLQAVRAAEEEAGVAMAEGGVRARESATAFQESAVKIDTASIALRSVGTAAVAAELGLTAAAATAEASGNRIAGAMARARGLGAASLAGARTRGATALSTLRSGLRSPGNIAFGVLNGGLEGYDEYEQSHNLGRAIATGAGGGLGTLGGAAAGAAIGSIIPGVGTAVGGAVGGLVGGLGGTFIGQGLGRTAYDRATGYKPTEQKTEGGLSQEDKNEAFGALPGPSSFQQDNSYHGATLAGSLALSEAATSLGDKNEKIDEQAKKYEKIQDQLKAINDLQANVPASVRDEKGYSDQTLEVLKKITQEHLKALDPMNKVRDNLQSQIEKATAVTKAEKDQFAIQEEIRKSSETNPRFSDADKEEITTKMRAAQQATIKAEFDKQIEALGNELQKTLALTQADKDRVEIAQALTKAQKEQNLNTDQRAELTALLEAKQKLSESAAQENKLNPQGTALRDYDEQLKLLRQRLDDAQISQQKFNSEKAKLDADTLSARDPLGAMVKSQQEELQALSQTGSYREADIKSLQTINELKDKGLQLDKEDQAALEAAVKAYNRDIQDAKQAQSSGFEGFANKVGDVKKQVQDIEGEFSSGLSSAIAGALSGNKNAFIQFEEQMGQMLIKAAVDGMMKVVIKQFDLGDLFGLGSKSALEDADKQKGLIAGLSGKQAAGVDADAQNFAKQMNAASVSIQAQIVTITGGVPGAAPGAGAVPGAPGSPSSSVESSPLSPPGSPAGGTSLFSGTPANSNVPANVNIAGIGGTSLTGPTLPVIPPGVNDNVAAGGSALAGTQALGGFGAIAGLRAFGGGGVPADVPGTLGGTQQALGGFGAIAGLRTFAGGGAPGTAFGGLGGAAQSFAPQALPANPFQGLNLPGSVGPTGIGGFGAGAFGGISTAPAALAAAAPTKTQDIIAAIQEAAKARGMDPTTSVNVARSEGLNSYVGDHNTSFGPYQLHYGGLTPNNPALNKPGLGDAFTQQTGLDARDPSTMQQQIEFGLNHAKTDGWRAWFGAKNTGIGRWQGVNPGQGGPMPLTGAGQNTSSLDQAGTSLQASLTKLSEGVSGPANMIPSSLTKIGDAFGSGTGAGGLSNVLQTGSESVNTGITAMSSVMSNGASGIGQGVNSLISALASSGGGGGGGGGLLGGIGDIAGMVAHSGAFVGTTSGDGFRQVSSLVFRGAPRLHKGLTSDEFPAILQRGERVLTANDNSRVTSVLSHVANGTHGMSAGHEQMGGGRAVNVTNHFHGLRDMSGRMNSADQVNRQMATAVQRSSRNM